MKSLFALLFLVSVAHGSQWPKNLDTSATSLFYLENPRAEMGAKDTLSQIDIIKKELGALLDAHVKTDKHEEFYLPVPFELGKILVGIPTDVAAKLAPNFDANGDLDLSKPSGVPSLDSLVAKWKVTAIKKNKFTDSNITVLFDPSANPYLVADSFTGPDFRWATPNALSFIGGGTEVRRISSKGRSRNHPPTIYVLTLGWGDCPAGCMAVHRRYFEVRYSKLDGTSVKLIGEGGAQLPADMRAEYYK